MHTVESQTETCSGVSVKHICGKPRQNQTTCETFASLRGKLQVVNNLMCVLCT